MKVAKVETLSEPFYIVKVRKSIETSSYILPENKIRLLQTVIERSGLFAEYYPVNCINDENVFLPDIKKTKYDISGSDRSEFVVMVCDIDEMDLIDLIDYINENGSEIRKIEYFRNSELPEYKVILSREAEKTYSKEVQEVLKAYMRMLMDLQGSGIYDAVYDFHKNADVAKLLKLYSEPVQKYVCENVTKRFKKEFLSEYSFE